MKFKILPLFFFAILFSLETHAEGGVLIKTVAPEGLSCFSAPADIRSLEVSRVTSEKQDNSVGSTKQGDQEIRILADNDIKEVVKRSTEAVLSFCGYKIQSSAKSLKLEISIDEFTGDASNKLLLGKGTTRVALSFILHSAEGASKSTVTLAAERKLTGFSTKKMKRLEKTLNETLADVMAQLAQSKSFAEAAQDLSKMDY